MYEVELKAWLDDRSAVQKKLAEFAVRNCNIDKHDTYWHAHKVTVRVRREEITPSDCDLIHKNTMVTFKNKEKRVGTNNETYEVNEEHEFSVSNADEFETVLKAAGFEISLKKHKKTESWTYNEFHIELCYIEGLGDFIEIETLTDNPSEENTEEIRDRLLKILDKCSVPGSRIESRYYKEMLAEKGLA